MFIRDFADETYEDLCRFEDESSEILWELTTQHQAETAHYGDSWPGAQLEIARARRVTEAMRAELNRRLCRFEVLLPPEGDPNIDSDIPF